MADEQQTENVESTTTENVETKEVQQEQPKKEFVKNDKGHQVDIDRVLFLCLCQTGGLLV